MKKFLKLIPIPICGLILALASLGNLLKEYNLITLGNWIGLIAFMLLVIIILKVIITFSHVKESLSDPIIASVSPTFTMATMVLCTYLSSHELFAPIVRVIWLLAIIIHYYLMAYFIYNFVIKPDLKIEHLYPSWFIVFIGIGVITVTSPNFFPIIGQINFWLGLFFYLFLLPLIIHRVFFIKNMPNPTLPLITIIAAPGSLELTGYLKAFEYPNLILIFILLIVSQLLYWFIIIKLTKIIRLPFYPSYAAFTFPLVISAMAMTCTNKFLISQGINIGLLGGLAILETLLAMLMVIYVSLHYFKYLKTSYHNSFSKMSRL